MTDDFLGQKKAEVKPVQNAQSGIRILEMFTYTKLKIYPDGSVFMELKGRPKDMEFKPKTKQKAQPKQKVLAQEAETY